jgi:hypothetical protein
MAEQRVRRVYIYLRTLHGAEATACVMLNYSNAWNYIPVNGEHI